MDKEERRLVREKFNKEILSKMEKDIITESIPVRLFSSGVYVQDKAFYGGVPFGRMVGLYAEESAGKTTTVLRMLGEVNKINHETGKYDLSMENPCGAAYVDLEHSFEKTWAKKLGFDEDLEENGFYGSADGQTVGDLVRGLIDADMYSIIAIDSLERMLPKDLLESDMETNEQGRRAQLLYKCFRKWTVALLRSAKRNRDKPWRVPTILYTNHLQWKMMTMYPEIVVPGGKSQRYYASYEIILSKIAYNKEDKKEFGLGTFKGYTQKNKATGARGRIFEYRVALKDMDDLSAGQVDNAASILKDVKAYELMQKTKEGYEIFGEHYRVQDDFKQRLYSEPEY